MSRDPADVGRAPVDVVGLMVEHQFEGGGGVEHVAAHRMEHPLQASGGETLLAVKEEGDPAAVQHTTRTSTGAAPTGERRYCSLPCAERHSGNLTVFLVIVIDQG